MVDVTIYTSSMCGYCRAAKELLKSKGVVIDWQDRDDDAGTGHIRIQGEIWNARAARNLRPGDRVRIVSRDGLTLTVEPE
ncbi:MAG: hypothetical protein K8F62_08820 [Pseudorhodoplanes sp.]|nr:hypothetical protein [Pseudorhodoplanes sp.]